MCFLKLASEDRIRAIIFDKTGSGKKSIKKTIIGQAYLKTYVSGSSSTPNCSHSSADRNGLKMNILDISDISKTSPNKKGIKDEIAKYVRKEWPHDYPNAIILVLKKGRYTEEESNIVQHLVDIFGEKIIQYFFVIFQTTLGPNEGMDLNHTESGNSTLSTLIRKCEGRYMVFTKDTPIETQVEELLKMIIKNVEKKTVMQIK